MCMHLMLSLSPASGPLLLTYPTPGFRTLQQEHSPGEQPGIRLSLVEDLPPPTPICAHPILSQPKPDL